ncbi:hypothetical protein NL676_030419 [Syzygium grande]|nr:hypothetical protein NL676_030419 [Syzygium grande]
MQDVDGSIPFFWGSDSEGNLVLSDDAAVMKKGCGKLLRHYLHCLLVWMTSSVCSKGHTDDAALLKQQYGLNRNANEAIIVIEAYRTLSDRRPCPAEHIDVDGSIPFFSGSDSEGNLVLSDDAAVMKKGYGARVRILKNLRTRGTCHTVTVIAHAEITGNFAFNSTFKDIY